MTRRRAAWLATGAATVLCVFVSAPTAAAAPQNPGVVVDDGVTQPVFGYADAIRERVWVEADFDTDLDGVNDQIALDIIRPALSDLSIKAPVIMDASPYYSTLGRGNEAELKADLTATACSTAGRSSTTTTSCRAGTRSSCSTWSARTTRRAAPSRAGSPTTSAPSSASTG